jgi:hypothetical protein
MQHGRYSSYTSGGCRCEPCKKAASDYKKKRTGDTVRLSFDPLYTMFSENSKFNEYSSTFGSWTKYGIDPYRADKICCELGVHPYEVWGDAWFTPEWSRDEASSY